MLCSCSWSIGGFNSKRYQQIITPHSTLIITQSLNTVSSSTESFSTQSGCREDSESQFWWTTTNLCCEISSTYLCHLPSRRNSFTIEIITISKIPQILDEIARNGNETSSNQRKSDWYWFVHLTRSVLAKRSTISCLFLFQMWERLLVSQKRDTNDFFFFFWLAIPFLGYHTRPRLCSNHNLLTRLFLIRNLLSSIKDPPTHPSRRIALRVVKVSGPGIHWYVSLTKRYRCLTSLWRPLKLF